MKSTKTASSIEEFLNDLMFLLFAVHSLRSLAPFGFSSLFEVCSFFKLIPDKFEMVVYGFLVSRDKKFELTSRSTLLGRNSATCQIALDVIPNSPLSFFTSTPASAKNTQSSKSLRRTL